MMMPVMDGIETAALRPRPGAEGNDGLLSIFLSSLGEEEQQLAGLRSPGSDATIPKTDQAQTSAEPHPGESTNWVVLRQ